MSPIPFGLSLSKPSFPASLPGEKKGWASTSSARTWFGVGALEILMPQLVLLRHGQSAWNLENRFTGWWDVGLTPQGEAEAKAAGELMAARALDFDLCFTSLQTRAIKTLNIALEAMGRLWLPVEKNWRLNERHDG